MKTKVENAGLEIGQTHSPFHVYNKDRKLFDCRIEEIKYSIIATSILGAKYTVVHPAQPCWFDADTNPSFTKDVNYYLFEKLIPVAKEYNIKLSLENMPGKGVPTSTPECLIEYIDMMDSDVMTACLDTGHARCAKESISEFAKKLGKKLTTLHLQDNCGRMDEHYIPYLGRIDEWEKFMQTLKEIGYSGTLNLESATYIKKFPPALREEAQNMSINVLRHLSKLMK